MSDKLLSDFLNGWPEDGEPDPSTADCKIQNRLIEDLRKQVQLRDMENQWRYDEIRRLQKLLTHYMANVIDHEGVAFLDSNNYNFNLSSVEKAELRQIEIKAREILNA